MSIGGKEYVEAQQLPALRDAIVSQVETRMQSNKWQSKYLRK
jgi:hypothetical protein